MTFCLRSLGFRRTNPALFKSSPGCGILYKDQGHTRVERFSNVDWARSREDRRSIVGSYVKIMVIQRVQCFSNAD